MFFSIIIFLLTLLLPCDIINILKLKTMEAMMKKRKEKIYGYKAFKLVDGKLTCRDFVYEVGKTYTHKGDIEICGSGFHYCDVLVNIYNFYEFGDTVCKVEILGDVIKSRVKSVTNKIKIFEEVSDEERKCNSGNENSGYRNSGNWNSGNWNSGNWNSGNRNSGNENSGNWNSGNWNSCDNETGFFNSEQSKFIQVFNAPCLRTIWEEAEKPTFINQVSPLEFIITNNMTNKEKEEHPEHKSTEGYLTLIYKEAWKKAYTEASKEDKELLKTLPNFDAKVFEEITGIKVSKEIK